jgi:hypothetical protein
MKASLPPLREELITQSSRNCQEELHSAKQLQRFLLCYFCLGMVPFSLAAVHRADHIFPLLPAAALLAGRELARVMEPARLTWLPVRAAAWTAASLGLIGAYYFGFRPGHDVVIRTRQMQEFARHLEQQAGRRFPFVHVDSPFALQFYLDTMTPRVSPAEAAELLASGRDTFVVLRNTSKLAAQLPAETRVSEVARWPLTGEPYIRVLSNHDRLERTARTHDPRTVMRASHSESPLQPGSRSGG